MSSPHHFALVRELIERMVEHMLDGLEPEAALDVAAEEMKRDIRLHMAQCAVAIEEIETDRSDQAGAKLH
jgi:hypothetical protein